jgi:cytochrome c-type biogenesis protein CcmH/NrfG
MLAAVSGIAEDTAAPAEGAHPLMQARLLLREAGKSFEQGNWNRVHALLDSVHVIDSANPDGLYLTGKLAVVRGDTAAAMSQLEEAARLAPRSTRIKLLLARLCLSQNGADECLALTDSVLAVKPGHAEALYLRGRGVLLQGDTAQANEIFERVLAKELNGKMQ